MRRRQMGKKYKTKRSKGLNSGTAWTETDTETLCQMYFAGFSKWEIAKELKRSSGAVEQRTYIMGLHKKLNINDPVSDTLTSEDATWDVSSDTTTSTLKRWWNRLVGKEN
jgi:DNA-binding NarL/FixJ family response regulator